MKVVIAPQSFKGSVAALAAAQAIARGVRKAAPEAQTILAPVADGGDGTLDALVGNTGGQIFHSSVTGPLGDAVAAAWGVMGDGQTAVVEMAQASGLALLPPERRNPRTATTQGTGEIIREALERGFTRIIVGLGGSATNDAGTGMASALGVRFRDAQGQALPGGGAALARLDSIDLTGRHPGLAAAEIIGATDVTNPLCGPEGASAVYGPQKGASPEVVAELDAALANFARIVRRDGGMDFLEGHYPGAGAAGGLGAGLLAFAGATLYSGIDLVCQALNFEEQVKDADLVITGEGRADLSSIYDKSPVGVARKAAAYNVPTILLAGSLGEGYAELYRHGIAAISCIADGPMTLEQSLARTEELLEGAAEWVLRLLLAGGWGAEPVSPTAP